MSNQLVLVVDDDADGRGILTIVLTMSGYTVTTAANGMEALVRARNEHPSVILLDLMMPVMDGRSFRAEQAQDPRIANIPVIVVSAHSNAREIARGLGAAGCIDKPVEFAALLASVGTCCSDASPG